MVFVRAIVGSPLGLLAAGAACVLLGLAVGAPLLSGSAHEPSKGDSNGAPSGSAASPSSAVVWAAFAEEGRAVGQMHQPRSVTVRPGAEAKVFVADRTGRILRFALLRPASGSTGKERKETLEYEMEWALPMVKNGFPAVIVWSEELDCLLVGETHYGCISRYSADGELLGRFGRVGSAPGSLQRIQGIAPWRTEAGGFELYVTDTFAHSERVQVFTLDGVFLRQWGGPGSAPGKLNRPTGVVLSEDGVVYVADAANHRIQAFSRRGELLAVLQPPSLRYPYDLSFDREGRLYCVEFTGSRVVRFDFKTDADVVTVVAAGEPGRALGQFAQPWGMTVAPDGLCLVADTRNHRIVCLRFREGEPTGSDALGWSDDSPLDSTLIAAAALPSLEHAFDPTTWREASADQPEEVR